MSLKKKLGNIVWHIENNREVLGDTQVLDQVLESLKGLESELPQNVEEAGRRFATGLMMGMQSPIQCSSISNAINETHQRKWYGTFKGYNQWDIAKDWCQMSNDDFFNQYGFNFVPKGQLFDDVKRFLANK
ncbi:hypothetical protein [Bacillus thuringiensis]|uniref:hypothetical protein n=1 Tax=Bacillus thuringiensis TaxID=1428 RepID=UPI003A899118